ncbi:MAG: hypothetical protein ACOVP1_08535 [Bacteroidia bacterium]
MQEQENQSVSNELDMSQGNADNRKQRTAKGFSLIGMGSIILFGGCIVSMVMPSAHPLYHFFLYTPTSIGASMVIYGMYCVLE